MTPSTLLRTTGLLLALTLPLSANALMLKTSRITPRQTDAMRYASSSAKSLKKASSSAPYINTIRNTKMGYTFKAPETWKVNDGLTGVYIERKSDLSQSIASINIVRKSIPKNQQMPLNKIYNQFIQNLSLDPSVNRVLPDTYLPSFNLTASGTLTVASQKALSLSYTGESRSQTLAFRRVDFVYENMVYTIYLVTLPQYLKEDGEVFERAIGSLNLK